MEEAQNLVTLMEQETQIQRAVGQVNLRKREAIVASDLVKLEQVIKEERQLLAQLHATSAERIRVTIALGKEIGAEGVSFEELASRVREPEKLHLQRAAETLRVEIEANRRLVHVNRMLLEFSIGFINDFFRVIGEAVKDRPTYGNAERKPAQVLVDRVV